MRATAVLIVLVIVRLSLGQTAGTLSMPEYHTFLLGYPQVQKELRITAGTANKIRQLEARAKRELMLAPPSKPGAPVQRLDLKTLQARTKKAQAAVLALLSPAQKARLKQVSLQYSGPFAMLAPEIGKPLQLNPDQLRNLHKVSVGVLQDFNKATTTSGSSGYSRLPRKSYLDRYAQARVAMMKSFEAQAIPILRPAQRQMWQRMKGKPFATVSLYKPLTPTLMAPAGSRR